MSSPHLSRLIYLTKKYFQHQQEWEVYRIGKSRDAARRYKKAINELIGKIEQVEKSGQRELFTS